MCRACGSIDHRPEPARAPRFAALRNRDARPYLFGTGLAMMGDNIEHVITYWVLWREFHSPALAGFQVISHWLPFLLFSVLSGSLADRYDCRRVIQSAQALFMVVSLCWGLLFLTDSLQVWHACVLLVLHGCAGALWGPAEQMMLHDFVGRDDLPSAVRLNATFRSLGVLCGPVVGSALLLLLGPTGGIFANIAIYLPLTILLFRTRFTGHVREGVGARPRVGPLAALRAARGLAISPTIGSMIILAGLGSFFVGASIQTAMPEFAESLGAGATGLTYGALLFAAGFGGVAGGLAIEATGWLRPTVRTAVVATVCYGLSIVVFALTGYYVLALIALMISGVANFVSMSVSQTVVQLEAPAADRGRIVGLYNTSSGGLRIGSGFTVGLAGTAIGITWSLALSAAVLAIAALGTGAYAFFKRPATPNGVAG
ncbi:MFS transporter [Kribbella sandramycini]|uniref:MFS family permease n=1 Tax=Kribbella sandramycini TaxID=60450 RepID=A0A7Y4L467_9ACTN|nr:MFS transporter [Kribbella sandramycini]MBB6570847.1 MFS family permease [Kribbella sandramycini]NOL43978.1 MFS transporter [Kribbella sandramycini]